MIGLEDLVTEEKDGTLKFKDFSFKGFKSDFDSYMKDRKEALKKANSTLPQLKNYARLAEANKLKKPLSMSMWGGKVLKNTGKGDSDFGIDCTGYAEIKRDKNDNWDYSNVHGYINFEIKISYTYEGQIFIYTIPCYYTIGGELGAGLEAYIYKYDIKNFRPIFSGTNQEDDDDKDPTGLYFNSHVKMTLGAGVGVPHVATFGATGEGSLKLKMGLSEEVAEYLRVSLAAKAGYELTFLGKKLASKDDIVSLDEDKGVIYSTFPNDKDKSWIKSKAASLMSMNNLYNGYSAENVYDAEARSYQSDTNWYAAEPQLALMSADYSNKDLRLLADNIYLNAQPQITDIDGTKVLIYTADNTERTAENRQMLVYSVYNEETGTWSAPAPVYDDGTAEILSGEEYNFDNNSAEFEIGHADVAISEINSYELLPTSVAEVIVENKGYSAADNIVAELHAGSEDGDIVDTQSIESLDVGESKTVSLEYNPKDYENTRWYVVLKTETEDFSLGNNSDYFVNECASDVKDSYVNKIISLSCNEDVLNINAYAANNTDTALTEGKCYAAVYGKSNNLKAVAVQDISLSEYSDTGVDLYIQNYTYTDGDYVKLFFWENTAMKPLAATDKVSIENPNYASEIISLSYSSDTLNVNASISNNTENDMIGKCYAAVYDKSNKLKSVVSKEFKVSTGSNANVDLQLKNYIYSDGDSVKLFVWDNTAMRPFTRAINMPVQNN